MNEEFYSLTSWHAKPESVVYFKSNNFSEKAIQRRNRCPLKTKSAQSLYAVETPGGLKTARSDSNNGVTLP